MSTIEESIAITDGVSPVFNQIAKAVDKTTGKFEQAVTAADKINQSVSDTSISAHITDIGESARATVPGFNAISNKISEIKQKISGLGASGLGKIKNALSGMAGQFAIGSLAAGGIAKVAALISEMPSKLTSLSDEYSGIQARLKLITQSQAEAVSLNDQIYQSALRARGSYSGMADAVSKIGLTAKAAFPKPEEIVPFVEGIQKLFTIGGTAIEQQKDAMLQLTQALGSGKLQGDEFRSIAEAAPMIEQMVSKFMGVTQGELKNLSSQGAITADIMKNAILSNIDEINDKFRSMPMTWSQIWQNMKTEAFQAFTPIFAKVSDLANSPAIAAFGNGFSIAIHEVADIIGDVINDIVLLGQVGEYIGSWLSAGFTMAGEGINYLLEIAEAAFPYIMGAVFGLAAAWAVLNYETIIAMGTEAASIVWHALVASWMWIQNAAVWTVTTAKAAWAAITMGLTGAQMMLAFAIAIVTGNLYIIAAVIIGVIVAALAIWGLSSINLRNAFAGAMDYMIDACQNGINAMAGMINGLIDLINKASSGLNSLFGTDIGMIDHVGTVNFQGAKKWTGYIRDGTFMEHLKGSIGDLFSGADMPPTPPPPGGGYDGGGGMGDVGNIANNTGNTAANTAAIKDALDATDEDLKYLRETAEQEAVNKYTTAEIKVEMGGVNNIVNSDVDLDGMMRYMNDSLFEAMSAGAEVVHP